jgi:hypothetical protein
LLVRRLVVVGAGGCIAVGRDADRCLVLALGLAALLDL